MFDKDHVESLLDEQDEINHRDANIIMVSSYYFFKGRWHQILIFM